MLGGRAERVLRPPDHAPVHGRVRRRSRDLDLARPFFNANTGAESSEIVGRPGIATGFVEIDEESNFYGAELNARYKYWEGCNNKLDLIGGLRFLYLDEQLTINEQSTALPAAGAFAGISRAATDQFHTKNRFYGAQIGAAFTHTEGPWTFELTGKVAAGVTRSIVDITGSVTPISGGTPPALPGGLLALNSNIGSQSHQHFSVVPEVGLNVGYDINQHWRIYGGYSLLYWTGVSRPGNQIDRSLDVNRIPGFPAGPATTSVRPVARAGSRTCGPRGSASACCSGGNQPGSGRFWSRYVSMTSLPLSLCRTSDMNARISSSPRPLRFSRLAGSVGSGRLDTSNPGPSSRMTNTASSGVSRELTCTRRSA